MANFIAFDSTGQAIAIVPAETAEEATALVLQNPELADAVKLIPEQETWVYKAQNQPAEMAANIQQAVQSQQQEDLANEPWFKKIGRNVTSAVLPNAMATANAGRPDESIQEALLYGDVPMYAGLATGNPALAGAGAIWGNTVGQIRGMGRSELDPMETGLNTIFAGIPVVGGAAARTVGQGLQKIAPSVAYYAVKPTMKMMGNPNPPNFNKMLKEGLFSYFGGINSAYKRVLEKITPLRKELEDQIAKADEQGIMVSVQKVRNSAKQAVRQSTDMTEDQQTQVLNAIDDEMNRYADKHVAFVRAKSHQEAIPDAANITANEAENFKYNLEAGRINAANKRAKPKIVEVDPKTIKGNKGLSLLSSQMEKSGKRAPIYMEIQPEPVPLPQRPAMRDQWTTMDVIEEPAYFESRMPIAKAYNQKTAQQNRAYQLSAKPELGDPRSAAEIARGFNRSFGEVAPDVRAAAMADAEYEPMVAALARRMGVPAAQYRGLGLNDMATMTALSDMGMKGQFAGLLGKRVFSTTGGAQMLYDAGGSLMQGRPGLSALSLTTANQAPNIDFLMGKIFGDN